MEEWKECGNSRYCIYLASNLGRIKSISKKTKKEKILKPKFNQKNGYLTVRISKIYPKVHRLVCKAFLGESNLQVDHINRNRSDNRLINLRYCTPKENSKNQESYNTNILIEDRKDRSKVLFKLRYEKIKQSRYTCICGSNTMLLNKRNHERTTKHLEYIKSLEKKF